mmetsp:Transcript_7523/g.19036  ORF Transcript_7523/g.19036 Transcript_7523/m.19036 type:complete len:487 (+) Transcript_7523:75-1535(+)
MHALAFISVSCVLMGEAFGNLGAAGRGETSVRRLRGAAQNDPPGTQDEAIAAELAVARTFDLVKMESRARSHGAVCLDGTPGAFYISQTPVAHRKTGQWVIHLQGGGWCYDEPTCYNRSVDTRFGINLGSSAHFLPNQTEADLLISGMLSENCTENPTFCNFNFVLAKYCDGTSFSGNREDPVVYTDASGKQTKMWFRGRRILDAILDTLIEDFSLDFASEILLSGDSAGGLAVFNHANYVHRRVQRSRPHRSEGLKFRLAPSSGFFLYHQNVGGKPVWQEQMRYLFHMSNWTLTDNECLETYAGDLQWLCLFPQNLYKFIDPPIFILNSALDLWQVSNILASERIEGFPNGEETTVSLWSQFNSSAVPGWESCSAGRGHIENCGPGQIYHMNTYMESFTALMLNDRAFEKSGNGAFLYGCFDHAAELRDAPYRTYTVGGVSMRDALSAWWLSQDAALAQNHVEIRSYKYPASVTDTDPSCRFGFA